MTRNDPFTDDEHRARAMLMGRIYRRNRGYYYTPMRGLTNADRVDAITLEPVTEEELVRRGKTNRDRFYD